MGPSKGTQKDIYDQKATPSSVPKLSITDIALILQSVFFVDLKATFLVEKFCLRMTRTKFLFNDMHEGKKSMNNAWGVEQSTFWGVATC